MIGRLFLCFVAFGAVVSATEAPHGPVLSSTEVFRVTPQNGVWDVEYGTTDDPADISFSFQIFRVADGLRVVADVVDDKKVADDCEAGSISCPSWDDDCLECFFDGNLDKSEDCRADKDGLKTGGEFTLVVNGAAQSDYSGWPKSFGTMWNGSVTTEDSPEGGIRYHYDLYFTWGCLGREALAADEPVVFGFNICVHDDDDGKRNDHALYWKGHPEKPCRDESKFGTICL